MSNRKVNSNEAGKNQPQGIRLSDELSDLLIKTAEHIGSSRNFDINEKIKFLLAYVKILEKYISDKDTKNALIVQTLLDHAFYNLGLSKPEYLTVAARRGGRADKKKKGICITIKDLLPKIRGLSPVRAWRFFKREYPKSKPFSVGEYEVYFEPDHSGDGSEDVLVHVYDLKESSIKYKTFEKYFYQALKENP